MRLGFALPQAGPHTGPDALMTVARRAEALGFDDLWVGDRLLYPLEPQAPYPGSLDGKLPAVMQSMLDPFEMLSFVAAHTTRIGLGTSVLNLPFYNPVLLARRLTTIDIISRGRLRIGFGTGWLPDEFDAVGIPMRTRGRRTDEALQVLKAIWTTNPVHFEGRFFRIPPSIIDPKPVQKPHPPIYFAAYAPAALRRVARAADGWIPAGLPTELLPRVFANIRTMARDAGRDPNSLDLVVRANVGLYDTARGARRLVFTGDSDQIRADIRATRDLGASALHFDAQFAPNVDSLATLLERLEQLWTLAQEAIV